MIGSQPCATKCKQLGHVANTNVTGVVRKWIPKPTPPQHNIDKESFQLVKIKSTGKATTTEEDHYPIT